MEDKLRKIFDLYVQQGLLTEGEASFEKWSKANENQQEQLFKLGQKSGIFSKETPLESFSAIWGVKKKDESEPTSQEGDMASTTPVVEEEPISSESSEVVDSSVRIPGGRRGDVVGQVPDEFGGGDITRFESGRRHRGQRSTREEEARDRSASLFDGRGGTVATGEKDTALERTFGKNQVTDFFGDIWRAGAKGIETGNTVDEAMEIMYKGKDASSQDIQDYLDASASLAERGESDEMRSFNQAFEAAGGGAWGFLMGMWDSPTAISEIAITSITQMANPASAAAAGATTAAFTGGGAGIGALAGGVGAAPGAVIGAAASIPYAIGAAGATLEAGLSFSEFLQEEIAEKGLELDEAGVRAVFADPEAMLRIRMKAAGRGVVIGVIDGLTAGVAGKIGAGITKGGVKTGKALKRSKLEALGAGTVVEGIGGGVGEATARAVVGQDMDALEIGFEMVGGGPGSILSVGPTLLGKGKYAFGPDGAPMTREEMIAMVTDTDDATFAGAKLEIKGDPGLKLLAEERKAKLRKQAGIIQSIGTELDGLSPEGRKAAIELETELSEMGSPITRKGKASKKALQDKLDALYENDPGIAEEVAVAEDVEAAQDDVTEEASDFEALMNEVSPSVEEDVAVTEEVEETTPEVEEATTEEAIQALEVEDALRERITGKPETTLQTPEVVEKKRQELTKQKQDAIQESITEEVDVQEQTPDGQPMGEGDASGGTSIESESQTETAPTTTEEIELTAGFTEEGVEVKAPKRKGRKVNDSLTVLDQTEEDSHYGSKDFKDSNPGSDKNSHEKMLLGRAQKAVKAIQALFPGLNIVMHRSDSTYKDHVSTNSRGAFNPNTNTIHINMPKATGKTIGHEVFHAILKAKFGSEINIQRATKLMLKSLRRGINKSTSLSKEQVLQLEKYSQIFEGDQAVVQEEEFLAEFVGLLSETYTKLEVPQQTVIKKWIVKVAKMLGIPSEDVLTESDRDVIDLLNTIAGKVTEGKEIAEADIKSLEKLKDKKKPAAKKPSAKKPAAKKPAAKKPLAEKPVAEKPLAEKPLAEKPVAEKPVAEKPAAKKPAAKKPVAKKPVAEKPAAKKPKALSAREKSALKIAERDGEISIVALEKELGLGYAEAGDVIFLLEERGLVAPFSGRGEREYIGPKIKTQAVTEIEGGQKVSEPASALKTQAIGGFEVSYTEFDNVKQMIKDGLITEPKDVSFLLGQDTVISSPDDMLVGRISFDNKEIHEGEGGLFFVTKYGDVWAASDKRTATELSKNINASRKKNGGKGFLTLTKGTDSKLVSSTSGVNSSLAILDKMLEAKLISASKFRAAVVSTVRKEGGEISLTGSSKKMMSEVIKHFSDVSTTTFEKRGTVVKKLIGELAKSLPKKSKAAIVKFLGGDPKKSVGATTTPKAQSLVDLVAGVAAEKLTKGLKTGDIYAVIEVDGEVEAVKGDHKSYPWHVRMKDGSKPVLHLPKNREHGSKYLTRKSGKAYRGPAVAATEYGSYNTEVVKETIKTQAIPPIKQTKREFVARIEAALQGEGSFAHMTAENPANKTMSAKENAIRNKELEAELEARGYDAVKIGGKYGRPEKSFFVPDISEADAIEIGKKYGQESVAHSKGMLYTTGKDKGKRNPITGEVEVNNKLEDYYSEIQTKGGKVKYSVGYNFDVLTDDAPIKTQAYSDDLMYQYGEYTDKNGELDVDLVLEKIDEDIASLKNKDLIEEKLKAFEELIIPAISEDITSPALTQFESDVLMDPNATAESIERGFRKAKNIIDEEGSIDFSKTKESGLFKGGEINLPAFERFVDKNPEYQGVFNDWEKLFTESTEALLKDLNAFNVVDIELAESFKKQLQETDIKTQAIEGDIKTQIFNPKNTAEDIIKFGRENNFSDAAIKDYLVRVKKLPIRDKVDKKTKKVIEGVDTLMALDSIPASFGNMKGGVKVGKKLFARVEKFRAKLIKENEKRKAEGKGMPPFSEAEIMDQTIEFLESQPAYINEGTKQKMETDQQTQMIIDMQKSLGVNPTKGMNTRIRSMRQKMMDRRKGAKGLQAVKRELRNFIRQALPTIKGDTYSKSELMKLLGKVAKADEKNINNLMEEVVDIVTTRQVKALDAKIESVLNGTYEVVQAGRLKGVKIDTDTRERLEAIKEAVSDDAMTAEDVVEANLAFNEEFNVLNEKPNQTEEDRNRMVDLAAIMSINNSKLMEDVDIDKLESLSTAEDLLADIIGEGKEAFKEQLKADHERYVSNLVRVYKAVTGETIDPSDPQVMQEAKEILKDLKNRKESRAAEKGLKKYVRKIIEKISAFNKSSESVEGLMEIIAEAPGEILGGDARKIVYEGLNAGTRVYKKRMMEATKVIQDKVKEIYGKNWRKQSRVNSVRKDTGVYRTGGKEAVERAQKKYDANPTRLNKRNLAKVKAGKTINLSPNEIAQQWQQYQDPANLPSFANEDNLYFGEDHARIMAELVETIGGEDGKILEMAKWQIEEFYPSMYPHLNEAYKNIYRTNMPWNVHYAGRIKREGVESQGLDLLGRKESFNTQVGAASTKVRIKNAKPIQPMDMMGAMVTYTTDMEWFAAMGPTIRDIDKLFSNPLMRNAIENVAGESTMRLIDHHMKNIAARGVNTERGQDMVNAMNNMFATTRLGFSPNIAIKQLTSIPTYALDIGAGNYAYHAVKNKTEFLKVFNEIRNNSVYLQDRVSSDIRQVTESYSGKQDIDFVPKSASSWFMNTMMGFIKAGDITAIYLGGMPNYSFYKAEYMKANPNATEQQAIDHAIVKFEADTKSTQQSMDLQDKDFYQTSGAIARSFNLFKTSQKQYLRKEFSGLRNMRRGFRDGNMKQAAKGAVKFATFHAMMPVLFQFIASGLPGLMSDWDEEDGEDILRAAIIGNFNALFVVGDIVQGISDNIQDKPYADRGKSLPVYEFFGEIGKQYGKYATYKDPEKKQEAFMKMMTRLGELVTGGKIPMYNLRRMYKNLEKAGEAKDEREVALRLLNYSDYVIEGPGSDKDTMTFDPVSSGPRSRETRVKETRSRETRSREPRSRDRR